MAASLEEEQRYQRADHHKLEIQARRDQLEAKKMMGNRVFWLVTIWLTVVMVTIWMQATGCFLPFTGQTFYLSDAVLIALVTTTTGNIALFLTIVIKHLFPKELRS
ncbi:MAG: hypothetical protein JNL05_11660 [Flavobacteriales bacterium]|nr:hypothetical protein [Flavobacteriales bacterium]